jgi:hypothetical protein
MLSCIVLSAAAPAITLLLGSATFAQTPPAPTNTVVTIGAGNKFQKVLGSSATARRMIRIGNNNTKYLLGVCGKRRVKRIEGDIVSDIRHCDPQLQRDADSTSHTFFGLVVRERSGTAKGPKIGPGLPTAETFQ